MKLADYVHISSFQSNPPPPKSIIRITFSVTHLGEYISNRTGLNESQTSALEDTRHLNSHPLSTLELIAEYCFNFIPLLDTINFFPENPTCLKV